MRDGEGVETKQQNQQQRRRRRRQTTTPTTTTSTTNRTNDSVQLLQYGVLVVRRQNGLKLLFRIEGVLQTHAVQFNRRAVHFGEKPENE
jgi:hypothetical protein